MIFKTTCSKNEFMPRPLILLCLGGILALFTLPAFGATAEQSIEWGVMGMKLFGGLALFLFGMEQMADALK
ncbi:MAG: hypothetical protein N0E55_01315, partial [Candidatus Thiodiazotropha taylori]|nr:hypothetical protein [Candidatus Thiodiazotropha taylori]MCW4251324.1 hypothetical protein [Candidatus Thiodiazotropha taylori]